MDLSEALELTNRAGYTDGRCYVARLVASDALSEQQRSDVLAVMDDPHRVSHANLARALTMMTGAKIMQDALGKHRRHVCACAG
ncbi:hypothetical protein GCM10027053_51780 [Intrasporangium mesophilum]